MTRVDRDRLLSVCPNGEFTTANVLPFFPGVPWPLVQTKLKELVRLGLLTQSRPGSGGSAMRYQRVEPQAESPIDQLASAKGSGPMPKPPKEMERVFNCSLRMRRLAKGLSMKEVAKACDVAITAVARWESGINIRLSTAFKVAAFFGVAIEELWQPLAEEVD